MQFEATVPTVADRIAQEVVRRYLEPILEPAFHPDSYGYRPGKSAIDAVRQARQRCWRYDWVLDLDVKGYFDSIDWELLLRAVRRHTNCPWVLLYIERWLKVPVQMEDGSVVPRTAGTPQGGVMAPRTQKITFGSRRRGVYGPVRGTIARSVGQRNAVPDDYFIVADENFLDEKPYDALAF